MAPPHSPVIVQETERMFPSLGQLMSKAYAFQNRIPRKRGMPQLGPISIPEPLAEYYEAEVKRELRSAVLDMRAPPSIARINNLLGLVKKAETIALDGGDSALTNCAFDLACDIMGGLMLSTEREFRKKPTSQNYFAWKAMCRLGEGVLDVHEYLPIQWKPAGGLTREVKHGDTLSRLAKLYYGKENLWDKIYEMSGGNFHPDLIFPGRRLRIP